MCLYDEQGFAYVSNTIVQFAQKLTPCFAERLGFRITELHRATAAAKGSVGFLWVLSWGPVQGNSLAGHFTVEASELSCGYEMGLEGAFGRRFRFLLPTWWTR